MNPHELSTILLFLGLAALVGACVAFVVADAYSNSDLRDRNAALRVRNERLKCEIARVRSDLPYERRADETRNQAFERILEELKEDSA